MATSSLGRLESILVHDAQLAATVTSVRKSVSQMATIMARIRNVDDIAPTVGDDIRDTLAEIDAIVEEYDRNTHGRRGRMVWARLICVSCLPARGVWKMTTRLKVLMADMDGSIRLLNMCIDNKLMELLEEDAFPVAGELRTAGQRRFWRRWVGRDQIATSSEELAVAFRNYCTMPFGFDAYVHAAKTCCNAAGVVTAGSFSRALRDLDVDAWIRDAVCTISRPLMFAGAGGAITCFHKWREWFAYGSSDTVIKLVRAGVVWCRFVGHTGAVTCVVIFAPPSGSTAPPRLVSCAADCTVRVWCALRKELALTVGVAAEPVSIDTCCTDRIVVLLGPAVHFRVVLLDMNTGEVTHSMASEVPGASSVAWMPSERKVLVMSDRRSSLIDPATMVEAAVPNSYACGTADPQFCVVADAPGAARVYRLSEGRTLGMQTLMGAARAGAASAWSDFRVVHRDDSRDAMIFALKLDCVSGAEAAVLSYATVESIDRRPATTATVVFVPEDGRHRALWTTNGVLEVPCGFSVMPSTSLLVAHGACAARLYIGWDIGTITWYDVERGSMVMAGVVPSCRVDALIVPELSETPGAPCVTVVDTGASEVAMLGRSRSTHALVGWNVMENHVHDLTRRFPGVAMHCSDAACLTLYTVQSAPGSHRCELVVVDAKTLGEVRRVDVRQAPTSMQAVTPHHVALQHRHPEDGATTTVVYDRELRVKTTLPDRAFLCGAVYPTAAGAWVVVQRVSDGCNELVTVGEDGSCACACAPLPATKRVASAVDIGGGRLVLLTTDRTAMVYAGAPAAPRLVRCQVMPPALISLTHWNPDCFIATTSEGTVHMYAARADHIIAKAGECMAHIGTMTRAQIGPRSIMLYDSKGAVLRVSRGSFASGRGACSSRGAGGSSRGGGGGWRRALSDIRPGRWSEDADRPRLGPDSPRRDSFA